LQVVITDLNVSLSDASKALPASLHFSLGRFEIAPTKTPTSAAHLVPEVDRVLDWPQDMHDLVSSRRITIENMGFRIEEKCLAGMLLLLQSIHAPSLTKCLHNGIYIVDASPASVAFSDDAQSPTRVDDWTIIPNCETQPIVENINIETILVLTKVLTIFSLSRSLVNSLTRDNVASKTTTAMLANIEQHTHQGHDTRH